MAVYLWSFSGRKFLTVAYVSDISSEVLLIRECKVDFALSSLFRSACDSCKIELLPHFPFALGIGVKLPGSFIFVFLALIFKNTAGLLFPLHTFDFLF